MELDSLKQIATQWFVDAPEFRGDPIIGYFAKLDVYFNITPYLRFFLLRF